MDMKILRKIGLNDKEIKIYLNLLRLGSITASRVSKETNIDRATCYRYLDSLKIKGLLSSVIKNNIRYYQAAPPEKILEDLKEKENEYKKILPNLKEISNLPRDETEAIVYKGKQGLKTIIREMVRNGKNHDVLGEEGYFQDLMPIFFKQVIRDLEKNKIKERILCSKKVLKKLRKYDYKFSKTKGLSHELVLPTTTVIYSNKLIIINWVPPYNAIVITNKHLAKSYQNYFNMLWKLGSE